MNYMTKSDFQMVSRALRGEPHDDIPPRTLRRWIAAYRAAEHKDGSGYLGPGNFAIDRGITVEAWADYSEGAYAWITLESADIAR